MKDTAIDAKVFDMPGDSELEKAGSLLRTGGLVAFPTETVYGLGANGLSAEAVARIYRAKGRPAKNPVILHVADLKSAQKLTSEWPPVATLLANAFWPGPLTLVLPRASHVPDIVTAGGDSVGIRIPAHRVALALIKAAGVPIAAPSANRSNHISPTRAQHVKASLGNAVDVVLDGGPCAGGLESTVVQVTAGTVRMLRLGLITRTEIEKVLGRPVQVVTSQVSQSPDETKGAQVSPLSSPGQLARHYSPNTPFYLLGDGEQIKHPENVAWMHRMSEAVSPTNLPGGIELAAMPDEPEDYAAILYDTLHRLDMAGYAAIYCTLPPDTESWAAVRDRLMRAASRE